MKATQMIKPGSIVTQTFSEEHFKILELREYCKASDTKLKELVDKIESLKISKHESEKLKAEYGVRNTININNYESLLRAKNELYKYKCELKSEYVGVEKTSKVLKMKYNNIVSSYEAEWQKTLEQYNSSEVVIELFNIQQENTRSEKEIDSLLKLSNYTQTEFVELERNIKQKFLEKIIEFSRKMISYKSFINSKTMDKEKTQTTAKKRKTTELAENSLNSKKESIFVPTRWPLESHSKGDIAFLSTIDMSEFDDLCVPNETLENQNEEEMFSIICGALNKDEKNSKEKRTVVVEYTTQSKKTKYGQVFTPGDKKEKCVSPKILADKNNKSQYFATNEQQQMQVQTGELQSIETNREQVLCKNGKNGYNKINETINFNVKSKGRNDDSGSEFLRTTNEIRFDEHSNDSSNNGNFESKNIFTEEDRMEGKQIISGSEENFEIQYRPASSASSEEISIPMTRDNNKENSLSPAPEQVDQNCFMFKNEPEKNGFDLFKGFFSTGNESYSPTPSIFKLF